MDLLVIIVVGFIICCIVESIKDRIDAYKYEKNGGFYGRYPCFKPKPWEQEWIDKNKK